MWIFVAVVLSFGAGIGLTRWLMKPMYCPRCGEYMASRAREVAEWISGRKNNGRTEEGKHNGG
jgi:hypothetical protein